MSVVRNTDRGDGDGRLLRGGALLAGLSIIAAYLTAVYHVVNVVGDPTELLVIVGVTLVAATVLARYIPTKVALGVAGAMLAVGLFAYLRTLPSAAFAWGAHSQYVVALLSGHSILEIVNVKLWVLAVTPGPVFLTWYLALRRHYEWSALIGGATVAFFILTGDATLQVALVGTVGALALVALGTLERVDASVRSAEVVTVALAVVIVVSMTVAMVPQGAALSYSPSTGFTGNGGLTDDGTLEGNLLSNTDAMSIQGSIELSATVRLTVESENSAYWKTGSYDLYTGDGWTRQGEATGNLGRLSSPRGDSRTLRQTVTVESPTRVIPAAWRPVAVSGIEDPLATRSGELQSRQPLEAGDSYTVRSERPEATSALLTQSGGDYPDRIVEAYTQLPESTPDRVRQRSSRLTANANTPYETALTIERWLKNNYDYSLDVPPPGNNVADEFLFEREQGYCTYFATTMAVMLRTQGIPARMAVGYTPGERVGEDEWVVRGYNSHAWVEVYFPEVGWVQFDPTPAGPRENTENDRLDQAREDGEENVDTSETTGGGYTPPTPQGTTNASEDPPWLNDSRTANTTTTATNNTTTANASTPTTAAATGTLAPNRQRVSTDGGPELPSREELFLGSVALLGFVVGARRSGVPTRLYRAVWLRYQPRRDPTTDVERAYERVESVLERSDRPRRAGETVGQYVEAVADDERITELGRLYDRARYADGITDDDADRAVELADSVVGDR